MDKNKVMQFMITAMHNVEKVPTDDDSPSGKLKKEWIEAYEDVIRILKNYEDCRNELCLKCGKYMEKHNGACLGCRWEDK